MPFELFTPDFCLAPRDSDCRNITCSSLCQAPTEVTTGFIQPFPHTQRSVTLFVNRMMSWLTQRPFKQLSTKRQLHGLTNNMGLEDL